MLTIWRIVVILLILISFPLKFTFRYQCHLGKEFLKSKNFTPMFIAPLIILAKIWKQPKCPSTDERIKKMCVYVCECVCVCVCVCVCE